MSSSFKKKLFRWVVVLFLILVGQGVRSLIEEGSLFRDLWKIFELQIQSFALSWALLGVVSEKALLRGDLWLWKHRYKVCLCLWGLFFLLLLMMSWSRHLAFASRYYDLGTLVQSFWNTEASHWLWSTWEDGVNRSRLAGGMTEWILVPVAWLYHLIWSDPLFVLLLQSLAISLTPLPLWLMSQEKAPHGGGFLVIPFLMAWGCWPLLWVNIFDFHAYGFLPVAITSLVYGLVCDRKRWIVWGAASLCLIRNELCLYGLILGPVLFFWKQKRRLGLMVSLSMITFFAFSKIVLSPLFGDVPLSLDAYHHHSHLGKTAGEIAWSMIADPWRLIKTVWTPLKVHNLLVVIWGLGCIPLLLGFPLLLISAPLLVLYFSSDSPLHWSVANQYNAAYSPFFIAGACFGLLSFEKWFHRVWNQRYLALLWIFVLHLQIATGFHLDMLHPVRTIGDFQNLSQNHKAHFEAATKILKILKEIPSQEELSLSVSSHLAPHAAHRKTLYLFPNYAELADLILVDTSPKIQLPESEGILRKQVQSLLLTQPLDLLIQEDGIFLLKRRGVL